MVAEFNSQEIANTLNALAKFGQRDGKLVEILCEAAKEKLAEFNSQEIANTLNALVRFGVCDEELVASFAKLQQLRSLAL